MSIKVGQRITLSPNMRYKNNPEKDEDFGYGEDQAGTFQQCQVLDRTSVGNDKVKTGFIYVRIHTDIPLKIGDVVTVKEFEYIQAKTVAKGRTIFIVGITIEETSPFSVREDKTEVDENGSCVF